MIEPRGMSGRAPVRVAVVGAGAAGLMAADVLVRADVPVTVYEGASRIGGRIRSLAGEFGEGLVTELGAEFIDSTHTDVLELIRRFELPLLDTYAQADRGLSAAYFFGNTHYTEAQVIAEFAPLAERLRRDVERLSPTISAASHSPLDAKFDRMSISEYLDHIGATGWIRGLLEVAYLTEYGTDLENQSCLNLLSVISLDTTSGFDIFGASDERYKVSGGNERIIKSLAHGLGERIETNHRLVSLRESGTGFALHFEGPGVSRSVVTDAVVLALPFTTLRDVELRVALPAPKRAVIDELGYGQGEKLVVGLSSPVWRRHGFDGGAFTDLPFQSGWDSSRDQSGGTTYSFFLGGAAARQLHLPGADRLAARFVDQADAMFPGMREARSGTSVTTQWCPGEMSRGSYSCYRPGQWTGLAGWERVPVGNLFFAGEHCSAAHQGFVNGALETGRKAAEAILLKLR